MKTTPNLIGFAGRAGAGKTTAALMLVKHCGAVRFSFADPIRAMLRAIGLTADDFIDDAKHRPNDAILCGKTPRHAMQTLGTEWGRQCIGEEIWLKAAMREVDMLRFIHPLVVFDDVRFDNEAKAIRERGGVIVHLSHPSLAAPMNHASERGVTPVQGDWFIDAKDVEELRSVLLGMMNGHD